MLRIKFTIQNYLETHVYPLRFDCGARLFVIIYASFNTEELLIAKPSEAAQNYHTRSNETLSIDVNGYL